MAPLDTLMLGGKAGRHGVAATRVTGRLAWSLLVLAQLAWLPTTLGGPA